MLVVCSTEALDTTLMHLRDAGARHCECVVLWLARRRDEQILVERVYRPMQDAKADMFHIPREGMKALHEELRRARLLVAAQVHSHPREAFHSVADDRWAIVRHEGALSLVVPNFATGTQATNFLDQSKVFRFSSTARWLEVPRAAVEQTCLTIR